MFGAGTMHTPSTHPSPSPHIHTPRTMDREESNASTASATSLYGSPYFSRTPSGGSAILSNESGGGEGDRLVNIQKEIQVLELVRWSEGGRERGGRGEKKGREGGSEGKGRRKGGREGGRKEKGREGEREGGREEGRKTHTH